MGIQNRKIDQFTLISPFREVLFYLNQILAKQIGFYSVLFYNFTVKDCKLSLFVMQEKKLILFQIWHQFRHLSAFMKLICSTITDHTQLIQSVN